MTRAFLKDARNPNPQAPPLGKLLLAIGINEVHVPAEGLIVLLYLANLLQWAVTPARGTMYYYYYPEAMLLGVAIALALQSGPYRILRIRLSLLVLVSAAVVFLWCYPRMAHLEAPWDCAWGCWS